MTQTKEERRAYMIKYRAEHAEELREKNRIRSAARYQEHHDDELKKRAEWRATHPEELREQRARDHAKHREERLVKMQTYYESNKEWMLPEMRAYQHEHREEKRSYLATYYLENKERAREKAAKYYEDHGDDIRHKSSEWRKANPEQHRALKQRHRSRKAGAAINDFTHGQWVMLQEAFDHCCAYCKKRAKGHLTQDHVVPLSKGGNHTLSNIVPACRSCNSRKHAGPPLVPAQPLLL